MALQYYMRGFNTVTLQYVEWVVNDQPDSIGTYSGVTPSNLTNIVVNKTVSSKVSNFLKPNESLGGTDGYFFHVNSYDWLHSTPPGPPIPVPPQISGLAIVRGSVDGVTPRDYATMFWNEGAQSWRLAFNTNGDGTTIGASLPLEVSSIQADNFITIDGIPALTGVIRIPTTTSLNSRSNNNTRDITLIGTDSSDHILIGDTSDTTIIQGNLTVLGTTTTVDSTVIDIVGRVIHGNWSTAANVSPPSLVAGYSIHRGASSGVANDGAAIIWTEGSQVVSGSDGYWRFATLSQDNDNVSASGLTNILDIMAASFAATSSPNPTLGSLPGVGGLRTQNNTTAVSARNAAGNADLLLLGSDSSNHTIIGTLAGNGAGYVAVSNTGALTFAAAPGPGGAAGGDLSGTYPNPSVAAISGASPINITPATLQWINTTATPTLTQASESTVTKGQDLAIIPQQSTHATDQGGGNLIVAFQTPTGVGVDAHLQIKTGATTILQIGPYGNSNAYGGIFAGGITPSASNYLLLTDNAGLNTYLNTGAAGTINMMVNNVAQISLNTAALSFTPAVFEWVTGTISPTITQIDNTTNSATATNLTIRAQKATGTTAVGGNLILSAGTGTSTNGYVNISNGAATVAQIGYQVGSTQTAVYLGGVTPSSSNYSIRTNGVETILNSQGVNSPVAIASGDATSMSFANQANGGITVIPNNISWTAATVSPILNQLADTTNSSTATNLTVQAQNATGTTSIGGNLILSGGTGTSFGGTVNTSSGQAVQQITISASTYSVDTNSTTSDYVIFTNSTSNIINITLPTPTAGRVLIIKDKTGQAATHNVTITHHSAETIDGATTYVLTSAYESIKLISDGTNWSLA